MGARPVTGVVKWGKRWLLTFEAFDDVDRDTLTEQFSRLIRDDFASEGYTATEEPEVFFKDSRTDLAFGGIDGEVEVVAYATVRGYHGEDG